MDVLASAPPLALDRAQRAALRTRAHHLDALVMVGKDGLTEGVIGALDQALTDHELVKVKLLRYCPLEKEAAGDALAAASGAAVVQRVGRVVTLFRPRPEPPAEGE